MKEGESFFLSGHGNDESGSFLALAFVSSYYVIHVGKRKKANGERGLLFLVLTFLAFLIIPFVPYSASMDSPIFLMFSPLFAFDSLFVLSIHLPLQPAFPA